MWSLEDKLVEIKVQPPKRGQSRWILMKPLKIGGESFFRSHSPNSISTKFDHPTMEILSSNYLVQVVEKKM